MITEQAVRNMIESVREDGITRGIVSTSTPYVKHVDRLTVSLPRFQSYRARTEAALVEEILDFTEGHQAVSYQVADGLVHLEV